MDATKRGCVRFDKLNGGSERQVPAVPRRDRPEPTFALRFRSSKKKTLENAYRRTGRDAIKICKKHQAAVKLGSCAT
jgi:hypothetical protein